MRNIVLTEAEENIIICSLINNMRDFEDDDLEFNNFYVESIKKLLKEKFNVGKEI